nr:SDR family oxidoreductase [Fredinandcohnia onubensis]
MHDLLNYKGKTCVVTGAASGMGEATAKLLINQGADVFALDIEETPLSVKQYIKVDLSDKESIEKAVQQLPNSIDTVFHCAGVAGADKQGNIINSLKVVTINFIGARYMIESLIPRLHEGSSITAIASTGGKAWEKKVESLLPLVDTTSFEGAQEWFTKHEKELLSVHEISGHASYRFSKEALILWMKKNAYSLSEKKIRLNTVSPGSTATPMSQAFNHISNGLADKAISKVGVPATPEDQAKVLIFLGSDLASYVSGQDIQVDYAFTTLEYANLALIR